jgi:hypothetical protein
VADRAVLVDAHVLLQQGKSAIYFFTVHAGTFLNTWGVGFSLCFVLFCHSQIRVPHTFLCEPMGRREIFHTSSLLVEIDRHFTREFVIYDYETLVQDLYNRSVEKSTFYFLIISNKL